MRRVGPVNWARPLRTVYYIVCFFNILITCMATGSARFAGIPVAAYQDNSAKRDGNSRVIAFCRVGSATRVERYVDVDGKLM